MHYLKRTWAEIDLDAVENNLLAIRKAVGGKRIIAVIKADAYGHGASTVARLYNRLGVNAFAVSNIDEARMLRVDEVKGDILILGYTPPELAFELFENGITQTVTDYAYAERLSAHARTAGVRLPVHVKIDSGMSRLGIVVRCPEDLPRSTEEIKKIAGLPNLLITGVFTHFSSADGSTEPGSADREFTERQFRLFTAAVDAAEKSGVPMGTRHCSNSAAIINYPEFSLDAVRPGVILYGYYPDSLEESPMREKLSLTPAMTLKTAVSQVKTLPAGSEISYGREYTVRTPVKTAVVSIGYADGYIRKNADGGEMTVNGKPARVLGRICMDMCMLDVTGRDDVKEGDEVVVFGKGGQSLEHAARISGTINYELTCLIGKRVPRVFLKNGETQHTQNLFLHL
ncbi:MAG: alanine racemase [Clostridia bacterium]|nr:alanine racemase [Clostridia bacterium]